LYLTDFLLYSSLIRLC